MMDDTAPAPGYAMTPEKLPQTQTPGSQLYNRLPDQFYRQPGKMDIAGGSGLDQLRRMLMARIDPSVSPGSQPAQNLPKPATPDEARQLPLGTLFMTPDGRVMRRA